MAPTEKPDTKAPALEVYLIGPKPEHRWVLYITPDFCISGQAWPNPWRRFWHWALLGWRWERDDH